MNYTPEIDPSALGGAPAPAPTSSSLAYTPEISPESVAAKPDKDRFFDALIKQESGGKQFGKDGMPLTSSKGAIGIAQVMPGTAPEAARLAGLPYDEVKYRNDPAYNKAIGFAYFNKQADDFGDLLKGAAAYNAGPAALKAALNRAARNGTPDAWLQYLPAETQKYVPSIAAKLSAARSSAPGAPAPVRDITDTSDRYGTQLRPAQSASIGDIGKEVGASLVESVGGIGQFVGEGGAMVANAATGTNEYEGKNILKPAAEGIRDSMTEGGKQARAGAAFQGDMVDALMGDWSQIKTPDNVYSWLMTAASGLGNLIGSVVPILGQVSKAAKLAKAGDLVGAASAGARAKVIGAASGGAMTGGAAVADVRESVTKMMDGMTHAQLMQSVPAYADAFNKSGDPMDARSAVTNAAAQWAGGIAAVAGAAGGAFNAKVIEDFLVGKGIATMVGNSAASRLGRGAVAGVGAGFSEGGQETSEKVGQNIGENIGLGRGALDNATRDTFGDFVAGAMIGGPVGAAGGVTTPSPVRHIADQSAKPNSPLSRAAMKDPALVEMAKPVVEGPPTRQDIFDLLWSGEPVTDIPAPPVPRPADRDPGAIPAAPLPPLSADPTAQRTSTQTDPTAGARIEYAAAVGEESKLGPNEDGDRLARALANVERNKGVASPEDAYIIDQADIGKPYDSIGPAVDSTGNIAPGPSLPIDAGARRTIIEKRKAALRQLVDNGFTKVERSDSGFNIINPDTGQSMLLDGAADAQMARVAVADGIARAAADTNTEPTDGQKAAGNYKKGIVKFDGLNIAVENPVGSERTGKSPDGSTWRTPMRAAHYGYIKGTSAADGDAVDVYLARTPAHNASVYVVDQYNKDGTFDETKSIIGARSEAEALRVYDAGFSDGSGPSRRRGVTAMSLADFKKWAGSHEAKKPAASDTSVTVNVDASTKVRLDLVSPNDKVSNSLRGIAEMFGKKVEFFAKNDAIGDGFVKRNDDSTIYISASSKISPVAVFGHELMHLVKRENPKAYAAIESVVRSKLTGGALKAFDVYTKNAYTKDEAIEEITSDLGGNLMTDAQFWREVFDRIEKDNGADARGIIAKLVAMINSLIDGLKDSGKKYATDQLISDMGAVRAAVRDGLADYIKAHGHSKAAMQAEMLRERATTTKAAPAATTPDVKKSTPRWQVTDDNIPTKELADRIIANRKKANGWDGYSFRVVPTQFHGNGSFQVESLKGGDEIIKSVSRGDDGNLIGLPTKIAIPGYGDITAGEFKPAKDTAVAYMKSAGLPYNPPKDYVKVDVERAKRIAAEYDRMKHAPNDPTVKAAYDAMIKETIAQYKAILTTGLKVEFIDFAKQGDPYAASPRLATEDVRNNNHMWVFSTRDGFGSGEFDPKSNPLLADTEFKISGQTALANDVFRVVHDYFGHVKDGVGFRADGEENAWRSHAAMFTPLARRAMTTETRGQNSWVNFGPNGEKNRKASGADTVYADQKTGLLPEWVSEEGAGDARRSADRQTESNEFKTWFGDSKIVDGDGNPLVLYRGGVAIDELSDGFLNAKPRNGYAVFASSNPHVASTYANPDRSTRLDDRVVGAVVPMYVKADTLKEYPVRKINGKASLDFFEFDAAAKRLRPGEAIVARQVVDVGPRASLKTDPDRLYSYASDVYAFGDGTSAKSATGNNGQFSDTDDDITKSGDREHAETLRETGFWGKAGAGSVVMSRKTGRILLPHRSMDVQEPGTWGTWGGAIDGKEDPMTAAKRELQEEAGLDQDVEMIPLYVFQKGSFKYHNFLALVDDEFSPDLNWETQDSRWVEPDDIPSPMHPGLKSLLSDSDSIAKIKEKSSSRSGAPVRDNSSPRTGIHFSKRQLKSIDGRYYGQGLKGAERARVDSASDSRLKDRAYFYVDEGRGVRPEAGVGGYAHEVELPRLYDAKADPEKLWNSGNLNATETAILDAGYDGYYVKKHETGQGFAVVIGPASHGMAAKPASPSMIKGDVEKAPEESNRALMSAEIKAVDVSRIPGAKLTSGTLKVPMASRDAANDEMKRIGSDVRFSKPRVMTTAEEITEIEKRFRGTNDWLKAPNGEPSKLNERQWVHVRTNSFKTWFGDWERAYRDGGVNGAWNGDDVSKVVGNDGEPLVVYHGSDEGGFSVFKDPGSDKRGDLGIFAADSRAMAATYVRRSRPKDVSLADRTRAELEDLGYGFEDVDGGIEVTDPRGYVIEGIAGPVFSSEREALAAVNIEPMPAGDRPGVYALFMNIRSPQEAHFEGANWDGQRVGQWMVVTDGEELVYNDDGRGYFQSRAEAEELADAKGGTVEKAESHYETTDSVMRDAKNYGHDGAIIRETSDDGGAASTYRGEWADVFVAKNGFQLKSADFNDGQYSVSDDDIRRSAARTEAEVKKILGSVAKHLTEPERAKLRKATAQKLVDQFKALPSVDEFAAIAIAGQAKRGWYRESAQALVDVFGADAPRFAALLAAMSPQISVEGNLNNALGTWKNWVNEGRSTKRADIVSAMKRGVFGGNKLTDSVLPAWIPNSVRALTTEDPETTVLSGPKVNSFMLNLRGDVNEVTNDAWMANFSLVNQTVFGGKLTKGGDPGKGTGYLAMSARVRAAAKRLNDLTGDTWTPSEVQETVWSWAKTLYELQNKDFGAVEILQYDQLTDELIAATPDFRSQLLERSNQKILADAGIDVAAALGRDNDGATDATRKPTPKARPFDSETQGRLERRAARRLEKLRETRLIESNARAMDGINFSRARLEDFDAANIAGILDLSDWAIMTGENPNDTKAADADNKAATKRLEAALTDGGYKFAKVTGKYSGPQENSFIVVGIDERAAQRLSTKFGQESVLTRSGLLYRDDSFNPALGVEVFESAPDDFYTKNGDTYFRVNIDFDNRVHHHEERAVKYEGHLGDGSGIQAHSAGGLYPYVVAARESRDGAGWEYGLIGGELQDYKWIGTLDQAVDHGVDLLVARKRRSAPIETPTKTSVETKELLSRASVLKSLRKCLG